MCVRVSVSVCLWVWWQGRGYWGFYFVLTCVHSPDPADASLHTFFYPCLFPQIFFVPAPLVASSLNAFFCLLNSVTAAACLSPLFPCFFPTLVPHFMSLWLVRTSHLLPHSLSEPP